MTPFAKNLTGNSSHVFSDLNDNNAADAGEEVGPSSPGHFTYPLKTFTGDLCSAQYQCTWDPFTPFSWQPNRAMDATQLLYFTSVYHDHLLAAPIGSTRAAGNFETRDGDPVQVDDLDGANTIRTQPLDCPVGAAATVCPGTPTAGSGGYTYGDFGHISRRGPEVHADGEIWAETLWDLRSALGTKLTESLVTRAMELSPADPSYLDMRNSILMADRVNAGGRHQRDIWKVFAHRGMGFFAATVDGTDTAPVEDFSLPPAPGSAAPDSTARSRRSR